MHKNKEAKHADKEREKGNKAKSGSPAGGQKASAGVKDLLGSKKEAG